MHTFLIATFAVALAEIGDKTQLLSLVLAARFRRPWIICLGILLATLVNHALAGIVGDLLAQWLTPSTLRWVVVASLAVMAVWILIPDKLDEDDEPPKSSHSVLVATMIAFFLAEMGDKTQIATVILAAQYQPLWAVIAGTTTGILIANVPVVWLGARFAGRLPLKTTRIIAACLFAALAVWVALR